VKEGGWAELPDELLAKVLEVLQAAGQAGGLGFSQTSATVRLVCVEGRARCAGDAAGAETADQRRGLSMLVLRWRRWR
jgi:hypothetical protein